MKRREATNKSAFQFRQDRTHALLLLVKIQKFLLNRRAQLTKIGSSNCVAHGNQDVGAGFDQNAFIDSDANFPLRFSLENQYSRCERCHAVKPAWQESERPLV